MTDSSLTSIDKILVGVFVPVGVIVSTGATFMLYSYCFKGASVTPVEDSDIDLEKPSMLVLRRHMKASRSLVKPEPRNQPTTTQT